MLATPPLATHIFRADLEPLLRPTNEIFAMEGAPTRVFRVARRENGSKRSDTDHISLPIHTASFPNQVCSGSPNTLPAISTPWSRGWVLTRLLSSNGRKNVFWRGKQAIAANNDAHLRAKDLHRCHLGHHLTLVPSRPICPSHTPPAGARPARRPAWPTSRDLPRPGAGSASGGWRARWPLPVRR